MQKLTHILILIVLGAIAVFGQKLSPEEQKIVDYIDGHSTEALALLERSVNIDSPTENLAGVKAVGTLFGKELEALGMTVKWIPMPTTAKRAGHLVAEMKGTKGKR